MCEVVCALLRVKGAAVSLLAQGQATLLCAAGELAVSLEDVQFTIGEGPSVDAVRAKDVVAAPYLGPGSAARWPAFAAAAADCGAGAVFAFPLRVGAARLGTLTLYQDSPGPLSPDQEAEARVVVEVVTWRIIAMQAAALGDGSLGADDAVAFGLADAADSRAHVHQASGMVSVQLGIGIVDALVRLRAHAFSMGRPVAEVAAEVVAGTRRFDQS
jgi:GAF domain-containing protein